MTVSCCSGGRAEVGNRAQPYRPCPFAGIPVYVRGGRRTETARPVNPGGPFVEIGARWGLRAPDQKTLRCAKIAISSRMAGVGAESHARLKARFCLLIVRRCLMRSIMLLTVVLISPGPMGLLLAAPSWCASSVRLWKGACQ